MHYGGAERCSMILGTIGCGDLRPGVPDHQPLTRRLLTGSTGKDVAKLNLPLERDLPCYC